MKSISAIKKNWFNSQLEELKAKGISRAEIARRMSILPQTLNNVIKGQRSITDDFLDKFIATFGINQIDLFQITALQNVSAKEDFSLPTDRHVSSQDVPLYALDAAAGLVAIFNSTCVEPADYLRIPNLPPVDGALYVRGESMSPLLKSGDIVIFKKKSLSMDSIIWGEIYILSFNLDGDTYTSVKYIRKSDTPGFVRLVSYNPDFAPKDIPLSSITALALVKASLTFHTME